MESRFVTQTKETVKQFLHGEENKNTASKTKREVALIDDFLKTKKENRKVEQIPPQELDDLLSMFILSVANAHDDSYHY